MTPVTFKVLVGVLAVATALAACEKLPSQRAEAICDHMCGCSSLLPAQQATCAASCVEESDGVTEACADCVLGTACGPELVERLDQSCREVCDRDREPLAREVCDYLCGCAAPLPAQHAGCVDACVDDVPVYDRACIDCLLGAACTQDVFDRVEHTCRESC